MSGSELVEHRLSKLESALFSIDQSLQKLVAIEQSQHEMRTELRESIKQLNDVTNIVAAHSERLDSHRWAFRTVFGSFAIAIVGGIWAVIK